MSPKRQGDPQRCTSAINLLKSGPVIASVAPSFVANYPGATIATMEKALKQLGFAAAEETAIGASIVKTEYENIVREGKQEVIISTCCHSVNTLVEKYYPEVLPTWLRSCLPCRPTARRSSRSIPA